MSLATRCPSCGTVFRVVHDQLKVSEGWVRCGRCNEVFSALDALFDLERDVPPPWPPAAVAHGAQSDEAVARQSDLPPETDADDTQLVARIEAELFSARHEAVAAPEPDYTERTAATAEPSFVLPEPDNAAPAPSSPWIEPVFADDDAPPATAPEFVRHAERLARWQQPRMRFALIAASLVLSVVLAAQWALHYRDLLAARWPAVRPALAAWCAGFQCKLEAPRRIEDISVENTTLTRAPGTDAFRLTVTLRNRGALTLALPSIDLSLTDNAGQLIARRALAPAEFHAGSPLIAGGAESALQLLLTAGTPRVTGYTVEIFYP